MRSLQNVKRIYSLTKSESSSSSVECGSSNQGQFEFSKDVADYEEKCGIDETSL